MVARELLQVLWKPRPGIQNISKYVQIYTFSIYTDPTIYIYIYIIIHIYIYIYICNILQVGYILLRAIHTWWLYCNRMIILQYSSKYIHSLWIYCNIIFIYCHLDRPSSGRALWRSWRSCGNGTLGGKTLGTWGVHEDRLWGFCGFHEISLGIWWDFIVKFIGFHGIELGFNRIYWESDWIQGDLMKLFKRQLRNSKW